MRIAPARRLTRPLMGLVLLSAVLGGQPGNATSNGSRLVASDGFDDRTPGTLPPGWTEAGGSTYRVIPDATAPSAPLAMASLAVTPAPTTRGATWSLSPMSAMTARASLHVVALPVDARGAGVAVRASADFATGYVALYSPGDRQLRLQRRAGAVTQTLGAISVAPFDGWAKLSVEAFGSVVRASLTLGTGVVRVEAVDPSPLPAGVVGLLDEGIPASFDDVEMLDPVSATFSPTSIAADGVAHRIDVTLFDDGRPSAGRAVSLASDRGATDLIAPAAVATDASGRASFTLKTATPGAPTLSLRVDGAPTSAAQRVRATGTPSGPHVLYRQTFDGPESALPASWQRSGALSMSPSGGVAPSAGVLTDNTAASSSNQLDLAEYRGATFADATVETHARMPSSVAHRTQTFGVAGRITSDDHAMYLGLVLMDTPSKGDDVFHVAEIVKRVDGRDTVLAASNRVGARLDQWQRLKLEITGTSRVTLRMKIWPSHDPEPLDWTLNGVDLDDGLSAGYAGVGAEGGGGPSFDNVTVSTPHDAMRTDEPAKPGSAQDAYAVVVNPVRGGDVGDGLTAAQHLDDSRQEAAIIDRLGLPASWLARYDALVDPAFVTFLRSRPQRDEIGLYLEVTPLLARDAGVEYHSGRWSSASALFVTGYTTAERKKLIDTAMARFHDVFGSYPSTSGAFWIDAWSLRLMHDTYGLTNAMTVSENLCTDGYTEWGGYFNHPYYPTTSHARMPASDVRDKLDVVMWPWSVLDPLMGYRSVFYAGLANNYLSTTDLSCNKAANLATDFYAQQIDVATDSTANGYGWFMGGLENAYDWAKVGVEYAREMEAIAARADNGWLEAVTAERFAVRYRALNPGLSPAQSIVEQKDWSGGDDNVLWYYSPRYRARVVWSPDRIALEDLRSFDDSIAEPNLSTPMPPPRFDYTLPSLLDVRRDATLLRGTSGTDDEAAGANVRNVVVARQAGRAQIAFDSDVGHTVIAFGPEGFTIDRSPIGSVRESIALPAAAPHDWLAALCSPSACTPTDGNPGSLRDASLDAAGVSVWLGTATRGSRGGAVFVNSLLSGGSLSASMTSGAGALEETPFAFAGSHGEVVTIVAPATETNWQQRLALARSSPSLFR